MLCRKHAWRLAPPEHRAACPTKKVIWQQCHVCGESRNIKVEDWLKERE
jgi:hypothetical protein